MYAAHLQVSVWPVRSQPRVWVTALDPRRCSLTSEAAEGLQDSWVTLWGEIWEAAAGPVPLLPGFLLLGLGVQPQGLITNRSSSCWQGLSPYLKLLWQKQKRVGT